MDELRAALRIYEMGESNPTGNRLIVYLLGGKNKELLLHATKMNEKKYKGHKAIILIEDLKKLIEEMETDQRRISENSLPSFQFKDGNVLLSYSQNRWYKDSFPIYSGNRRVVYLKLSKSSPITELKNILKCVERYMSVAKYLEKISLKD